MIPRPPAEPRAEIGRLGWVEREEAVEEVWQYHQGLDDGQLDSSRVILRRLFADDPPSLVPSSG
jgi:hypothetical protein